MKIVEMVMPQMGESILECTVLSVLKNVGDHVEADESVMEVATDKVDTEVPSSFTGILKEWLVKVDDVVAIGSPIAKIEVSEDVLADTDIEIDPETVAAQLEGEMSVIAGNVTASVPVAATREGGESQNNNGFFSPLVLNIAEKEGVSRAELAAIKGTGAERRVTKDDMLAFLKTRIKGGKAPVAFVSGEVEIIEMDRMRKMIAQRMLESKQISPHVTAFAETDMTAVVHWRDRIKHQFLAKTGEGITFTSVLVAATVDAIRKFPLINVSVEGDKILVKKDINIGIAVALQTGNLIVPVIHRADQYDLAGLTLKVNDLVKRARHNKLTAADLANGTYTISNIGTFGNLMGTPIIMQPQVGILAFGAIQKKPAVVETPGGDTIGIRQKMFISHSFDHRVVDGSLGGMFLKQVADNLENFDTSITFD